MSDTSTVSAVSELDIAVIGMSCRFPGAPSLESFWGNLRRGVESISFFSEEELLASGVPASLARQPNYVNARGILSEVDRFDAAFFGYTPGEAELMDPQHRLFLEEAWKALEHAGYVAQTYPGAIGLYAGVGMNTYLLNNLYENLATSELAGLYQVMIGNNKDFLTTRVSYKLNLTGPSVTVQTACSTSLVAIHLACQSLLQGESDMALAGGVSIQIPQKTGYLYQEGMILSPDGHCRAFDAQAKGIVGGNGVGIIVLKRLEEALADGDSVHAVIKSSAVNNDGALKVGYTAPSVEGQAAVISEAQEIAGIEAESITYVETHGTGTSLGDPIEIRALKKAFQPTTSKKGFCALGSVKTNVGHLDAAAGVASVMKTVLALQHQVLPPSLHFTTPNPQIDFANSPFYVNSTASEWKPEGIPRRAGVSSFGIGGTNAHVILEEAPKQVSSPSFRPAQLLILSARTEHALDAATTNLAEYLRQHPDTPLDDVAHTLQVGRKANQYRRICVCQDVNDAQHRLAAFDAMSGDTATQASVDSPVAFMFPGQGAQYVNMARGLYDTEPTFRAQVDRCAALLLPALKLDLRQILYPDDAFKGEATRQLRQTAITQPAIFVIEYALARLWMEWGVRPHAMIGHSVGEYVAACLAGVFSLEDALQILTVRARLMQDLPEGAMLSVPLSEAELQPFLDQDLALAAINTPSNCVVSGPTERIDALQHTLEAQTIQSIRLHTSHAFHSSMMDPILEVFRSHLNTVTLNPPQLPWVSTVTGNWISAEDVTNPDYWVNNLRQTVRFADGIQQLFTEPAPLLLEVGPGRTLSTLAQRHPKKLELQKPLASLRHPKEQQTDTAFLLTTLGKLWLHGVPIDWNGFSSHEKRRRVSLPTYPFEGNHYWVEPQQGPAKPEPSLEKQANLADWFYLPSWKRVPLLSPPRLQEDSERASSRYLVFLDESELGTALVTHLKQAGHDVMTVKRRGEGSKADEADYVINPREPEDYDALVRELSRRDTFPATIVHLWNLTPSGEEFPEYEESQYRGLYSLIFLAQALGKNTSSRKVSLKVFSNSLYEVTGEEIICPEKATLLGPIQVIPQEYPSIACSNIDLARREYSQTSPGFAALIEQAAQEVLTPTTERIIAYRGTHRWIQIFEPLPLDETFRDNGRLREKSVYLITGGLGGIGLTIAAFLAETVHAKLVLTGRSAFPDRDDWQHWLATHESDEKICRTIKILQEIEQLGAEVFAASADVTDPQQMQALISRATERFGPINGVIHAAGIAGTEIIQQETPDFAERILAPKVRGTLVLETIFRQEALDFFILFSSLSTVMGGFGRVDYCAANCFLDAFAHSSSLRTPPVSINWDGWQEVGMGVNTIVTGERHTWRTGQLRQGILPREGVEVFFRILGNPQPQIFVSTQDLHSRLKENFSEKSLSSSETLEEKSSQDRSNHVRPDLTTVYAVPGTQTEQKLVSLWQSALKLEQIGIHDNFFDLGGHSLLAMSLLAKIQQQFEMQLPLAALLETPTIAQLAQYIDKQRGEAASPYSPLVAIQPRGDRIPFFCVHPVDGHAFYYAELARLLSPQQPFYGLQAFGLEPNTSPLTRLDEMAAQYVDSLRAVQPEGPYLLGGFSAGGPVAYEMARQLQRAQEEVALLCLIDSPAPHLYQPFEDEVEPFMAFSQEFGGLSHVDLFPVYCELRGVKGKRLEEAIREDLRTLSHSERVRLLLKCAQHAGLLSSDVDAASLERFFRVYTANVEALLNYRAPALYEGDIVLFHALHGLGQHFGEPIMGWQEYSSRPIHMHDIPGDHYSILAQPHVSVLAELLDTCLEQKQ